MGKKKKKTKKSRPKAETNQKQPKQNIQSKTRKYFPVVIIGFVLLVAVVWISSQFSFQVDSNSETSLKKTEVRKPFPPPKFIASSEPAFDDFVGTEVCGRCHKSQFDLWRKSTHGIAGGDPSDVNILGQFDGKPRRFKDAVFTPMQENKNNLIFRVEFDNLPKRIYKIDAIVGAGRMAGGGSQTYFSRFPDGTLRFLPFDFIRDEQVWFGETKNQGWLPIDQNLSIKQLSEWPPSRILGHELEVLNCQECHGSQIQTRFISGKSKFETSYKSLSINCESCHGPGKKHVSLADSGKVTTVENIGLISLTTLDKDESLMVCFRCHALKDALKPGYLPGKKFQDYYSLRLPILGENPYFVDGRIKKFGYQQNHLFSDCYINGSMTCVDCHDPHSGNYRDINGKSLVGKFDNGQCTSCHPSKAVDLVQHTWHEPESKGSLCTSCHMPFLQHKAMGNQLRFARSDHTIPIPRPEFDQQLGIENACKQCHQEKPISWLQKKVDQWYGVIKPHKQITAALHDIEDSSNSLWQILLNGNELPIVQFSILSHLVENRPNPEIQKLDSKIIDTLKKLTKYDDIDLKSLALMILHLTSDKDDSVHNYLAEQLSSLEKNEEAIRRRWAISLGFLANRYRDRGEFEKSISTFHKALEVLPNDPELLLNLGITLHDEGNPANAIATFKQVVASNPNRATAHLNLGLAYSSLKDLQKAEIEYYKALNINPYNKLVLYNLGNAAYRKNDLTKAIDYYVKSVDIDPSFAPGYFSLARSYIKTQQFRKAKKAAISGLFYQPNNQTGKAMLRDLNNYLKE